MTIPRYLQKPPDNAAQSAKVAAPVDQFGGLTALKFAQIALCDKNGVPIAESPTVRAILTEGDLSIESQYQTPFSSANPDMKMPNLMATVQSGEFAAALARFTGNQDAPSEDSNGVVGAIGSAISGVVSDASTAVASGLSNLLQGLEGKTGFSKINSTEIFMSTEPVTLNLTLFFQALKDARVEVENQVRQLEKWALPVSLSKIGLGEGAVNAATTDATLKDAIFSGIVPPFVSLTYGGKTYKPMLIQSVSKPLVAPIDSKGNRLNLTVQVALVSRTAWDSADIDLVYGG